MLADITLCQRAVDCVRNGVHSDIRIRVPLKRPIMGDFDAAQDHMIAGAKAVYVIAIPKPDIHVRRSFQEVMRACEILRVCNFDVVIIAFHDCDVQPMIAGDLDIIGGGPRTCGVCSTDRGQLKPLGRLCAVQAAAILGAGYTWAFGAVAPGPQRIGDGQGRCRSRVGVKCFDHPINDCGRDAAPGAIVDQDMGRALWHSLKSRADRAIATVSAVYINDRDMNRRQIERLKKSRIIRVAHDDNRRNLRRERAQRPFQHRAPGNMLILFGFLRARPGASARRDHNCGQLHPRLTFLDICL